MAKKSTVYLTLETIKKLTSDGDTLSAAINKQTKHYHELKESPELSEYFKNEGVKDCNK